MICKFRKDHGFSTLELSIVLIIFSALAATFLVGYRMYTQTAHTRTAARMEAAQAAITDFKNAQGHYPCPANPTLARGDANYGRSDCGLTPVPGRDANPNGPDNVLIGAVPFATLMDPDSNPAAQDVVLGMSDDATLDAWGRKLTYAVSQNLTNAETFNSAYGAIEVVDENDNSNLPEPGTAHFIIVSHGENGRGAYMPSGVLAGACPAATSLPSPLPGQTATRANEIENCDNDNRFLSGLINENAHSYQDDMAIAALDEDGKLWHQVPGTNNIYNANPGNVGIGVHDPQERLEIDGDLHALQIEAGIYCDSQGENCMPSDFIGGPAQTSGTYADGRTFSNTCPNPGEVAIGIENNQIICEPAFTVSGDCPPGEVIIGMTSTGIICCPRNYPIPGHPNPHCRLGGCAPETESRTLVCPQGQSGQITERRTKSCPSGTWGPWTQVSSTCAGECVWVPVNRPHTLPGPGPTGLPGAGESCTCGEPDRSCAIADDDPPVISTRCRCGEETTCTPRTETRTTPCEPQYSVMGYILERRSSTCPGPVWGEWQLIERNCQVRHTGECVDEMEIVSVVPCSQVYPGDPNNNCGSVITEAWHICESQTGPRNTEIRVNEQCFSAPQGHLCQ